MPRAERITFGASLRRISWVNVFNRNPFCFSFVLYKLLKLMPSPSVQPGSHSLVSFDSFSDVGQVLQNYNFSSRFNSFHNNLFANNVICFFNMPSFSSGDSLQTAFSRARAVGLKFCTSCKKHISFVPKFSTSVNSSVRRCGEVVFTHIYGKYFPFFFNFNIWKVENKIKKPYFPFSDKFSFFNRSTFKILSLKISRDKFTFNAPCDRVKRKNTVFNGVRSFVVVHRSCIFKLYGRNILRLFNLKNLIRRTNFFNSIANHLRPKRWDIFSNMVIAKVMQCHPIPAPILNNKRNCLITCLSKYLLRFKQSVRLFLRQVEFKCYRSFHIGKSNTKQELKQQKERGFLPHLKVGVSTSSKR